MIDSIDEKEFEKTADKNLGPKIWQKLTFNNQ